MSQYFRFEVECAICGFKQEEYSVASAFMTGSYGLDSCPPDYFSIIEANVCPCCGYVGKSISDRTSVPPGFLRSPAYLTCDDMHFSFDRSRDYYRLYMISLRDGDIRSAFYAILQCAWTCDGHDGENAVECRLLALPLVTELIESRARKWRAYILVKADLLRRLGRFDELRSFLSAVVPDAPGMKTVLDFQLALADRCDTGRYTYSDLPEDDMYMTVNADRFCLWPETIYD